MIKRILLGVATAAACILPVGAEVQPGTASLLETMEANGIVISVNPEECEGAPYCGQYRWYGFKREMRLCPGDTIDAGDHNTIRHEAIHAIQHCVNVARGTNTDTAVIEDSNELMTWAREHLSMREIEWIQRKYPRSQWTTEIEAFAASRAYTSSEIEEAFLAACTAQ